MRLVEREAEKIMDVEVWRERERERWSQRQGEIRREKERRGERVNTGELRERYSVEEKRERDQYPHEI